MAKASVICTCRECGEKFTRTKICRNRKEADNWEEWAEKNFDLCGTCYYKAQQEEEKLKGFYAEIHMNVAGTFIGQSDDRQVAIIFGGDTMPHKEELKKLSAIYTDDYPTGFLGDLVGVSRPYKKWVLYSSLENIAMVITKVKSIGVEITRFPDEMEQKFFEQAYAKEKLKKEKINTELEAIGKIPPWPEEIAELFRNKGQWNKRFYGKKGAWRVYFSGEEFRLTDQQKADMERILKEREEWRKKKEEIETKYK